MKFLHPALVHFPIAFFFLELFLLCLWASRKDEAYRRFAAMAFRIGYVSIFAAMVTGYIDVGGFRRLDGPVAPHFYLALAILVFYSARAVARKFIATPPASFQIAASAAGNALIAYAAFLGGKLVFL